LLIQICAGDVLSSYFSLIRNKVAQLGASRLEKLFKVTNHFLLPKRVAKNLDQPPLNIFRMQMIAQWGIVFARISGKIVSGTAFTFCLVANCVRVIVFLLLLIYLLRIPQFFFFFLIRSRQSVLGSHPEDPLLAGA
jgi:hypothetical protein